MTSGRRPGPPGASGARGGRLLAGVREREPAAPGTGEQVWRDDAAVVCRRVLPALSATLVVVSVSFIALGVVVTDVLDDGPVGRTDLAVVRYWAEHRTGPVDVVTGAATWLANTTFVLAVTVVGAVVAARLTRRWVAPVLLVAAVGGEKLIYLVVSVAVGRDRPPVPTTGFVHATTSFPSGHVGAAVTLYGAIALLLAWSPRPSPPARAAAVTLAVLAPPLVAFARVYRGVHYVTDVAAGLVLGGIWLAAIWYVLARQFSPYASVQPSVERRPDPPPAP